MTCFIPLVLANELKTTVDCHFVCEPGGKDEMWVWGRAGIWVFVSSPKILDDVASAPLPSGGAEIESVRTVDGLG